MKIEIGTHRMVIINRWFTVKFPRIWITPILKGVLRISLRKARLKAFFFDVKQSSAVFSQGFRENFNESLCWKETKANFLAPVYFRIGIMEIQKTIYGEQLSVEEMIRIVSALCLLDGIRDISPHSYTGDNYHKCRGKIWMIDYGGKNLRQFISQHTPSLEEIINPKG